MFPVCADPSLLSGLDWFSCYLTTPKHLAFFGSFGLVMLLIVVASAGVMAACCCDPVLTVADQPIASHATCHQENAIIGRGVTIDGNGIEAIVIGNAKTFR